MDLRITPSQLHGPIHAIPSKSQAHRLLIAAAFASASTTLICPETNRDIEATVKCLQALGTIISRTDNGYCIHPAAQLPSDAVLPCGESGSTLRFLLPIAGALGIKTTFLLEGRLPQRPLSPLWEEMERMGCRLTRPCSNTILLEGKLIAGQYSIPGNISSQYITGLMFALPLIPGKSELHIDSPIESAPYITMTREVLEHFSPGTISVEGDWSNGAFFLAAKALGNPVQVLGLSDESAQGDRAIVELLPKLQQYSCICAADIPDLVPILAVVAAVNKGACFQKIHRLRTKESDRVSSVIEMITSLGGSCSATDDTLTVYGSGLRGGIVDSFNDHRIAMSAAIASTICSEQVVILGAEAVQKSYPGFWNEFARLGGKYEQCVR